jgi:hypothetical protein
LLQFFCSLCFYLVLALSCTANALYLVRGYAAWLAAVARALVQSVSLVLRTFNTRSALHAFTTRRAALPSPTQSNCHSFVADAKYLLYSLFMFSFFLSLSTCITFPFLFCLIQLVLFAILLSIKDVEFLSFPENLQRFNGLLYYLLALLFHLYSRLYSCI